MLKKAVEHAPTDQAKQAVGRLLKMYKLLALYGADDYVTFDLSMSGHYGYYTGIVFRAYTYGTGDAIVTGGRYDHLLEKFGKQTPSIGFAIIIDELQNALSTVIFCLDRRSLWRPVTTISSSIPMPQKNGPLHWQKISVKKENTWNF